MFSSRRMVFSAPPRKRPWSRVIGILAATLLVFAAGVYAGRAFPNLLGDAVPAPVTAAEF